MRISVIHDVDRIVRSLADAEKRHVPFALARALTRTAKDAQGDVQEALPGQYTLRNNWVKNGIRITPATKAGAPVAVVGSLEPFMARQETGGPKTARDHARIAVPVTVKRTKRDVIPKSQRPGALRGKPKVFMVKTAGGAGIVLRVGRDRYPLQMLYWLKHGVKVKPSFGFGKRTSNTVSQRFGLNFSASLSLALGREN